MPNSYVTFTGNGSNRTFSFAGIDDYLSTGYIKVYLNNTLVDPVNYTIDTSGGNENVVFTTTYGAPASGVTVKLARETPSTSAGFAANIVDFSDGSVLTAADLDKGFKGMLHIVQESNDTGSGALPKSADSLSWNAGGLRINNAAMALESTDLVTKAQLDAAQVFGSAVTSPQAWSFTGTGSQLNFTFSPTANATDAKMFIVEVGGVLQRPTTDYLISVDKIAFTSAPANGANIQVRNFGVSRNALDALPNSSVTTAYLADGAVTEAKLAADSVTAAKLAANAVDAASIQDGAVVAGKLASLSVTTANLQALSVATDKIANNAVTNDKLGLLSVGNANISSSAVTSDKIASNAVGFSQMNQNTGASAFTTSGSTRYLQVSAAGVLGLAAISSIPAGTPANDVNYQSSTGLDGFTNVNLRTPTNSRDAATKGYVDNLVISPSSTVVLGSYAINTTTTAPVLTGAMATWFEMVRTGAAALWWPRPKLNQGTWTMLNFNFQPGNTNGNAYVGLIAGANNATTAAALQDAFIGSATGFDANTVNVGGATYGNSDLNYFIAVRTA